MVLTFDWAPNACGSYAYTAPLIDTVLTPTVGYTNATNTDYIQYFSLYSRSNLYSVEVTNNLKFYEQIM